MIGIADWINKRALITSNRLALVEGHRTYTYQELAFAVDKAVAFLLQRGVKSGERIAILSSNNSEYLILYIAVAKLRCMIVPLNTRLTSAELHFQLHDSQASVLFVSDEFLEKGGELERLSEVSCLLLSTITEADILSTHLQVNSVENVAPSSPFVICYTSGTTGKPKGAVLTQENVYWNALNNMIGLDLTSRDRMLAVLPFFHIGGIGLFTFPVLLAGGTIVLPERMDPAQILYTIEKQQITLMMGVPTIFQTLLECENFSDTDFTSLRTFYSGGAPCPIRLIQSYQEKGISFGQGYGLTEGSPTVFLLPPEEYQRKIGSIGKPVLFCDVRIVDTAENDVEKGQVGELWVRGGNVIQQYWNLPDETKKAFRDGWFRTGDLAKQDEEGFYYIVGREKEMIISGGENIYPIEVEQVLLQHPEIEEAVVFGVEDVKWGEVPVATVIIKTGSQLQKEEIINHCLKTLAKYKCPKQVELVTEFPRSAIGKVNKGLLKNNFTKEKTK